MKTKVCFLLAILSILLVSGLKALPQKADKLSGDQEQSQTVPLIVSPALEGLAHTWAKNFESLYPDIRMDIQSASGMEDMFATARKQKAMTLMATAERTTELSSKSWSTVVGRNPVIFVSNADQYHDLSLSSTGISPALLEEIIQSGERKIFIASDPFAVDAFTNFSGIDPEQVSVIQIISGEELITRLNASEEALFFGSYALFAQPEILFQTKKIIPIDRNGNREIDHVENICLNQEAFLKGVWIGKYPKELSNNLMIYSAHTPMSAAEAAFLRYVLSSGQNNLAQTEFVNLTYTEQASSKARIPMAIKPASLNLSRSANYAFILATAVFLVLLTVALYLTQWRRKSKKIATPQNFKPVVLRADTLKAPKGVLFDRSHTWTFMEQDGAVKIGIDDFLQHITGAITRTEVKPLGEKIRRGEILATISQNGKKIQVLSPITGRIISHNPMLESAPALLNESTFDRGWVCRIEPDNWATEYQLLILSKDYIEWIKHELTRFKDFLHEAFRKQETQLALVILPDGGEIIDEILSQFGPETWEDFENKFMLNSKND